MSYINKSFLWDFDALKRYHEKYVKGAAHAASLACAKMSMFGDDVYYVKNLFNKDDVLHHWSVSDGEWLEFPDHDFIYSNKLYFEPGVTYTFSNVLALGDGPKAVLAFFDSNDVFLERRRLTPVSDSLTEAGLFHLCTVVYTHDDVPAGTCYCRLYIRHDSYTSGLEDVQIEVGSSVTSVVGYHECAVLRKSLHEMESGLASLVSLESSRAQLLERLSSRGLWLDTGHLANLTGSGSDVDVHYEARTGFDSIWLSLCDGVEHLTVSGVVAKRCLFFSSLDVGQSSLLGQTDSLYAVPYSSVTPVSVGIPVSVPSGSVLCLITLESSRNPDGYGQALIRQTGPGVDSTPIPGSDRLLTSGGAWSSIEEVKSLLRRTRYVTLEPDSTTSDHFWHTDGQRSNSKFDIWCYAVDAGKSYIFSGKTRATVTTYMVAFLDSTGSLIECRYKGSSTSLVEYTDEPLSLPSGTAYVCLNVRKATLDGDSLDWFSLKELREDYVNVSSISDEVSTLGASLSVLEERQTKGNKQMKVVKSGSVVRVRTSLSSDNDIVLQLYERNNNITFQSVYLGPKSLNDQNLCTDTYKLHDVGDMVGAVGIDGFWYLYGQHGWTIPKLTVSSQSLDSSDVGSLWEDANSGVLFTIGHVDGTSVYLLPVCTQDSHTGIWSSSWDGSKSYPTTLSHVSGGVHTSQLSGSSSRYDLPVQLSTVRTLVADGAVITSDGPYYCDELVLREHLTGYSVGEAIAWFPEPLYGGALIDIDHSFTFACSSVTLNQRLNVAAPFKISDYRGCIPMMPMSKGDYHSYSFIPKVKSEKNGHRVDLPYQTDAGTEQVRVTRNSIDLYDVNDQPDRCICYLKDDNGHYLAGVAGGVSLYRGLSKRSVHNVYNPQGYECCVYGGSGSVRNKFYPLLLRSSGFTGGIVPDTFMGELSCYFVWFDPSLNPGSQVYWYKDGSDYIVYIHSQISSPKLAVQLPDFMDGMSVEEVLERTEYTVNGVTSGSTLLSELVVGGLLYVSFDATNNAANYIVLKLR